MGMTLMIRLSTMRLMYKRRKDIMVIMKYDNGGNTGDNW